MHRRTLTALDGGRHALIVHGVAFNRGPAAMRGEAAILLVEACGTVSRRIARAEAIFPNGALRSVQAACSRAARARRRSPASSWRADRSTARLSPAAPSQPIGRRGPP
ncbi:hypothetical protein [Elioraea sp.]|uniref:hypothetical protein n=1 Tax=Elioraea sp. TaxID=2185103 RepID=UPI0025BD6DAF|nr:hypothetical protein [Elioraea sp.]